MNGSGTGLVYSIEARLKFPKLGPSEQCGMLLDGEWRQVPLQESAVGVPSRYLPRVAHEHGFVCRDAAFAIAYWFLAASEGGSAEVRLVEYEFAWSYSATRKTEGEAFGQRLGRLTGTPVDESGGGKVGK